MKLADLVFLLHGVLYLNYQQLTWALEGQLIVKTNTGLIQGKLKDVLNDGGKSVKVFLGVPYAKPPVGKLRFKGPQPLDPQEGIYQADKLPKSCVQRVLPYLKYIPGFADYIPTTELSEDCLYLNIWVPNHGDNVDRRKTWDNSDEKMPVMVYFHGGGFSFGSTACPGYDGSIMASEEGVIVVTVNYRLASLGFVSLDDKEVTGNAGLLDQRQALIWLKQNIEFFGGDFQRITIYGQSAGAASVGFHLMAPSSWKYFQGAILQSGAPTSKFATNQKATNDELSLQLARNLGCDTNNPINVILECMQKAEAQDVILNEPVEGYDIEVFRPVVDGEFLKESPSDLLKKGQVKNVDIIGGFTRSEGITFILSFLPGKYSFTMSNIKPEYQDVKDLIHRVSPNKSPAFLNTLEKRYNQTNPKLSLENVVRVVTDGYILCGLQELLDTYEKTNAKLYSYLYNYRQPSSKTPKWSGVYHGAELPLLFGLPLKKLMNETQEEIQFSKRLMRYWGNYARTRNPNSFSDVKSDTNHIEWLTTHHRPNRSEEYFVLAPQSYLVASRNSNCDLWNSETKV